MIWWAVARAVLRFGQQFDALGDPGEQLIMAASIGLGVAMAALLAFLPWLVIVLTATVLALHRGLLIHQLQTAARSDAKSGLANSVYWFETAHKDAGTAREPHRRLSGGSVRQNLDVPTHVALLRGINVGGRTRVAMADLREVVTSLGHTDVATYIQSGNVVFTTRQADIDALAAALERAIAEALSVRPKVIVLSRDELSQVIGDNPYPGETNPRCLHAVFSGQDMGADEVAAVAAAVQRAREKGSRDEAQVVRRTLYLRTPNGLGRSELAAQLARSGGAMAAGASTTARNWATVGKLLTLCDA